VMLNAVLLGCGGFYPISTDGLIKA
jgi:hypothetical protein